jgi:phage shock protein A
VPVEWVALVREDGFGPDRHQEDAVSKQQQLLEMGAALKPLIEECLHQMQVIQQQIKIVDSKWDVLDARMDEYDKSSAALRLKITEYETKLRELEECQNQNIH